MALIQASDASLQLPEQSMPAIQGLDFALDAGEVVAVLGGNGSGKSLLSRWLAGWVPHLLPATTTGTLSLNGQSLTGLQPIQLADKVQLVQSNPYSALTGCAFTVWAEVAFGPENLGLPEAEIFERVESALALCGATTLAERHPATLSGGEAQRVALAAALAMRPGLLLLDEAFSRLTPSATSELLERLMGLVEAGMTLVLFEKHFDLVSSIARQVLVLRQGTLVAKGTPTEVFDEALKDSLACDAVLAAHRARVSGHWRGQVSPPLDANMAIKQFKAVLRHG